MQILNFNSKINHKTAIALGAFDGIHIGHKQVINKANKFKKNGLKSVVLTFKYCNLIPESKLDNKTILTQTLKKQILQDMGVDILINPDFEDINSIDYKYFVEDILIKNFNAKVLVCGSDYKFGFKAKGNVNGLKEICLKNNVKLVVLEKIKIIDEIISSTLIKEFIRNGDMVNTNKYLGYYYSYDFKVTQGIQLARKLGFPTINQKFDNQYVIPKFGVYASFVYINGLKYKGVTNIGVKPTVTDDNIPVSETYIIEFNKEIYNQNIKVSLVQFIRSEKKFNNIEQLSKQIKKDIETCENLLTF